MKRLLLVLSLGLISSIIVYFSLLIYIADKAEQDNKVKSDVIMVLGGTIQSDNSCYGPICKQKGFVKKPRYNPCVLARIDHAVVLYRNHYAPKILMTGGTDEETNINEAETMKKLAAEKGIPEYDILTETKSDSTYENFAFSQPILNDADLHSVIIVTDPYHIARAALVAAQLYAGRSASGIGGSHAQR